MLGDVTLAFGNVPISLRYEGTECNSIQAARIDHAARCRGSCCSRRGAIASTVFLVRTRISVPSAPDQGWTKADRHFVFRAARAAPCGATGRAPSCVARWRRSCTTHKTRKGRGGYPRGLSRVTSRRVNDGGTNGIEPQFRARYKRPARAALRVWRHRGRARNSNVARGLVGPIHRKTYASPHCARHTHAQAEHAPMQPQASPAAQSSCPRYRCAG